MKSYFIAHGAPNIIFDHSEYVNTIKNIIKNINPPKGIVIFSAHYESHVQKIGTASPYKTIYDFYGFEDELYKVTTNYSSDKILADKIMNLLNLNSIKSAFDSTRGIDHGSWSILKLLYSETKIPIIQMSININLTLEEQYKIGKSLEELKNDDILIIGSGGIVHNLSAVELDYKELDKWALDFQKWIKSRVDIWDTFSLFNYKEKSTFSQLAVPREEHFIPFIIAMGTGDKYKKATYLAQTMQYKNLSLDIIEFE